MDFRVKITLCMILWAAACTQEKPKKKLHEINLTKLNYDSIFPWDRVIDSVKYIPLEGKEGSFLGYVTKLQVAKNGRTFVQNGLKNVLCFDSAGRFEFAIGRMGKGPGEYIELSDFWISQDERTLLILSLGKVSIYDTQDGKYISTIPLKFNKRSTLYSPQKIAFSDNDQILFWDANPPDPKDKSRFYCLAKDKEFIEMFRREDFEFGLVPFTRAYDGGIWIAPMTGKRELVKFKDGNFKAEINIVLGESANRDNYFSKSDESPFKLIDGFMNANFLKIPMNFIDNQSYLYFYCWGEGSKRYDILVNKNDMSYVSGIHPDEVPDIVFSDRFGFYAILQSEQYIKLKRSNSIFAKYMKDIEPVEMSDNPILVKIFTKNS